MNSFKHKVLFRCDAADIPELGTGHLYRCLTIAKLLKKKFRIKNYDIAFLIKSKNKYKKCLKILSNYKYKIIKINNSKLKPNSINEAKYLIKNPSNLLVIDRLGKSNLNFFKKINNSFSKKIIIDDSSKNRKYFDLSLNPLIQNVSRLKNSYIGFKYIILPTIFAKMSNKKIKRKNIFIFFGGYDKNNLTMKILKILNNIHLKLNIYIHESFKKKIKKILLKNRLIFFNSKDYVQSLKSSNIAITAGGMGLYDSIYLNKKIICIPQYKHQEINARRQSVKKVINLIKINDKNFNKKFNQLFLKIYQNDKDKNKIIKFQRKIINTQGFAKTKQLVFNLYEKSQH